MVGSGFGRVSVNRMVGWGERGISFICILDCRCVEVGGSGGCGACRIV